jgi:hypothetical protein
MDRLAALLAPSRRVSNTHTPPHPPRPRPPLPPGGTLDASCTHALLLGALSRALRCSQGCDALLPHLGFTAALAVQALDPARPLLRKGAAQAAGSLLRDLTTKFPQVDFHGASQQLAVGSARPLAPAGPGGSGGGGGPVHARAVAVFDVNGGSRRTVLLLPASSPPPDAAAAPPAPASAFGSAAAPAGPSDGAPAAAATAAAAGGGGGGGAEAAGAEEGDGPGLAPRLRHQSTMKRAEAAMLENWFGLKPPGSAGDPLPRDLSAPGAGGPSPAAAAAPVAAAPALAGLQAAYYPSAAAADAPVLSAADLRGGVAALSFSPSGSALGALLATAGCVVVWRLQASWTQRLSHLGSRAPFCQLPFCYLPVPALRRGGHGESTGGGAGGLGGLGAGWELRWAGEGRLEVLSCRERVADLAVRPA